VIRIYDQAKIASDWRDAVAARLPTPAPVERYCAALLEGYSDGRLQVGRFVLAVNSGVLFVANDPVEWRQSQLIERIWCVPGVAGWFGHPAPPTRSQVLDFERVSSQQLVRCLIDALGEDRSAPSSQDTMLELATAAATDLGAMREGTLCFVTNTAWSDFFVGDGWDPTVVVSNPSRNEITLLRATDRE